MPRTCPECGSRMEDLALTMWVCPACKLLQFEENGKIQTRWPHPVRVTGEEDALPREAVEEDEDQVS